MPRPVRLRTLARIGVGTWLVARGGPALGQDLVVNGDFDASLGGRESCVRVTRVNFIKRQKGLHGPGP